MKGYWRMLLYPQSVIGSCVRRPFVCFGSFAAGPQGRRVYFAMRRFFQTPHIRNTVDIKSTPIAIAPAIEAVAAPLA